MQKGIYLLCLFSIALWPGLVLEQPASGSQQNSLCSLQTTTAQGEHRRVRVKGVYLSGLDGQYLVGPDCGGRSTDIEFELKSQRNWKTLLQLSNKKYEQSRVVGASDPVLVTFEGVFYGPRVADPKLPEAIRKNYHPGWDHNNASMTKLVVQSIHSVEALPADHPCAAPKSNPQQWPCFQNPAPAPNADNTMPSDAGSDSK
jgi:hypothetical protein